MATRLPLRQTTPPLSALTGLLVLLAAYGFWSMPGLVARWGWSDAAPLVLLGWLAAASLAIPLHREAPRARLLACGVVVVSLRLAVALLVVGRAPQGDAESYLTLARNLEAGRGLGLFEPFMGSFVRGLYPPAYAVLLAGWGGIVGLSVGALSILSLALDGAAALAIARLGRTLGRAEAGRAAAWLYLIWPSTLFSAPLAQKESLCALLIVTLAILWVEAVRVPGRGRIAAIGVVAGLLALTQPGELPLAALFGLAMVPRRGMRRVLRIGVPAAIVTALVMTPWWIRNWLVFDRFVPLTSAGGVGLWIGNNPDATGNWMPQPAAWRGLPELAYGAHASSVARAWIVSHPFDFVRLSATKFLRTLGVAEAGLVRLEAMHAAPPPALLAALLPLCQASWIGLLGAAALATRRIVRDDGILFALVVACFVQMIGFGIWFEFAERHREFATPFLLLLAIVGAERIALWRGGWPRRPRALTFPA